MGEFMEPSELLQNTNWHKYIEAIDLVRARASFTLVEYEQKRGAFGKMRQQWTCRLVSDDDPKIKATIKVPIKKTIPTPISGKDLVKRHPWLTLPDKRQVKIGPYAHERWAMHNLKASLGEFDDGLKNTTPSLFCSTGEARE